MKQCHLPPDERPYGHIPELYIDADAMVQAGIVTVDEMDLITIGFGLITEHALTRGDGCLRCGIHMFERVGGRPGIVEAAMRVITAAAARLRIAPVIAIGDQYDYFDVEHRKTVFAELAMHWSDVVIKMRTCGVDCPTCRELGAAWPREVGRHGRQEQHGHHREP